jgi:hypothetical protein
VRPVVIVVVSLALVLPVVVSAMVIIPISVSRDNGRRSDDER